MRNSRNSAAVPVSSNSASAIDPADFSTTIDNPLLTLRAGTTFIYEKADDNTKTAVTVTHDTVVVDGVTCVVVHDQAFENGILIEDTFDWFAQDSNGNVWYFGEDTKAFDPANPGLVSTEGSWKAGVDGAKPGIVMEARPQLGDVYRQEFAPGVAEDTAKIVGLDRTVDAVYGSFDGALKTKEFTPLSSDVEFKFYVPGVGEVLTVEDDGAREQLTKIIVNGLGSDDRLVGYAGGDQIFGHAGDDRLYGLRGNDELRGGIGNDKLFGGSGGDRLDGGFGNDVLRGDGGADRFGFHNLNNGFAETDVIRDYHRGQVDVVDLPHGAASVTGEHLVDGTWQLTLAGDHDKIMLQGVVDSNHNGHILDDLLII